MQHALGQRQTFSVGGELVDYSFHIRKILDTIPCPVGLTLGVFTMMIGLLILIAGVHTGLIARLFSGTVIAGLLSAYYVQSSLAFSIPAILAEFLSRAVGLTMTADIYVCVIILLTSGGYAAMSLARMQAAE